MTKSVVEILVQRSGWLPKDLCRVWSIAFLPVFDVVPGTNLVRVCADVEELQESAHMNTLCLE